MGEPEFWDHPEQAKAIVTEAKVLKATTEPVEALLRGLDDVGALQELGAEAGDADTLEEADRTLTQLEQKAEGIELQSLLNGPNDPLNCFFTIQAGAGGTEAQDWSEML